MRLSLTFILLALLLAGCKGSAGPEALSPEQEGDRPWSPTEAGAEDHTPYPELHDFLMDELERLGKDPSRSMSAVATGNANRVFDLSLTLIDPDGPGGDPPTGVSINWSEVLIGDYDQNGLVNASDLTALGQNFLGSVDYDDAVLHGGFAFWPSGDPTDDGGVTPPASDSPAANWRRARIDGDRNSLLNQADITAIAVHWQEALSGYRIYRQAPGETEFTMMTGNAGTSDGLSVNHPTAPGNVPVLYSFEDDNAAASGIYLYYVAPYDLQSQQQGPASGIVSIDLDTGTVNSSPVASLSVTPDFAGAPAEITLDASASYDPDGSIAAWEWDFDGDGVTDWLSTDPLPEMSSDGTVDGFEIVEPGVVKATYRQGSDDYFQPLVRAIDDMAAQSNPADAQLGVSGWEYEILNESIANYKLPIEVQVISVDPVTDEIVAAGMNSLHELGEGLKFARRSHSGEWSLEHIPIPDVGDVLPGNVVISGLVSQIMWDNSGRPHLLIDRIELVPGAYQKSYLWIASGSPNWTSERLSAIPEPTEPYSYLTLGMGDGKKIAKGRWVMLGAYYADDKESLGGSNRHSRFYMLEFDNGEWRADYTGYDTAETVPEPRRLLAMPDGTVYALFNYEDELPTGIPAARWIPGEELGTPFSLDGGMLELGDLYAPQLAHADLQGKIYLFCNLHYPLQPHLRELITIDGANITRTVMWDQSQSEFGSGVSAFAEGIGGTEIVIGYSAAPFKGLIRVEHVKGNMKYSERLLEENPEDELARQQSPLITVNSDGRSFIIARIDNHSGFPETDFPDLYVLFRHLDPRLGVP